jgi:hypothetical protein
MIRFEFNEKEHKILQTLDQEGAMSPSRVSAATWVLPNETMSLLEALDKEGMVMMRGDTNSPDGKVVTITRQARNLLHQQTRNR